VNPEQAPTTPRRSRTVAAIVTTCLLLAGCAGFDSVGSGSGSRYLAAYRPFSSCVDLTSWLKDAMREQVTAWGLGGGWATPMLGAVRVGAEGGPVSAEASMGAGSASTTTNVQETGIDEGDLAENDGRYVYLAIGERLRVIDTTNADVVHTETIPVGDHQLILDAETPGNGNLVVVTNRWDGSEPETLVRHYRVTGAVPALTGADHLEGSLVSVRANNGKVHVVIRHETGRRLPFVAPVTAGSDAESVALETNRRVVDELEADDVLPRTFRVDADGTRRPAGPVIACERIGTPESYSGLAMTWVASIDLAEPGDGTTASAGVVADSEHVYASSGSLYVATVRYAQPGGQTAPIKPEPVRTSIHRFALTGEGAEYRASGSVAGRIVSSYSMSEHEELLRVATTTDDAGFGSESMSGIRVLETRGDELVLLGEVDGLGRGEQIQGVRFAGDLAFVVTFRQIDPLYTVDLADPANPRVRGELKIPGFSTWLLPVDGGRLLAFGRSGTDEGAITGVQWSLFNVADLDDPRLLATLGAGENSEAVWDPHAIAFEPVTGILLAPSETWNALPEPRPAIAVEPLPPDSGRMLPPSDGDAAGTSPAMIAPVGEYFANIAKLSGDELVDIGRVRLPTQGRRVMLVGGRLVSVNADGSVTVADGETLEIGASSL
jgi:hypothetical protein